jgi:transcription elongation GreA/GreB family factor
VRIREVDGEAQTVEICDRAPRPTSHHPASPVGRALMGRRVGDEVDVHLAGGLPVRRVRIEAIE